MMRSCALPPRRACACVCGTAFCEDCDGEDRDSEEGEDEEDEGEEDEGEEEEGEEDSEEHDEETRARAKVPKKQAAIDMPSAARERVLRKRR